MATVITTPEDVVNLALARIGFKRTIGYIYEGSAAAQAALTVYAQTRDELMRQSDWGFAEGNIFPTLLKSAPAGAYAPPVAWTNASPPLPWHYEYAYPYDCLKVRALKSQPPVLFNPDPQPVLYSVANDAPLTQFTNPANGDIYLANVPIKVLLCNILNPVLVYTKQVTDPTAWEADFVEAFAAALGRRIAPQLMGADTVKMAAADESNAKGVAMREQG